MDLVDEERKKRKREADKRYRDNNRDKIKQRNAARREKTAAREKEYRQENKEKIKERNRQYYLDNAEKHEQYRQENKERIINYCKEWRIDNSDYVKQKRQENKTKRRETDLKRKYNITLDDYHTMWIEQEGKCWTCSVKAEDAINKILYVDHNHLTGKVRGLLCSRCNTAIGLLQESQEIIQKVSKYLHEKSS